VQKNGPLFVPEGDHFSSPEWLAGATASFCRLMSIEREQSWQMAHSLWQALQPGTSYRLISGTLHQELCFYRISKLTCTIDILTALWILKFF